MRGSGNPGPERTCVGCGVKRNKAQLVRLVLDEEGRVIHDGQAARPGRGAYVCPDEACWALALKRKKLGRAFRRPAGLTGLDTNRPPWRENA
jgi:hypothetical protein